MTVKLIVYDLDGTLLDSAGHIAHTVNVVRGHYDLPPMTLEQVRPCIGDGAERLVEKAFFGRLGRDERATYPVIGQTGPSFPSVFNDFYETYLADPTSGLRLMDGVIPALEHLRDAGIAQAILTNKPHAVTLLAVDAMGLTPFMTAVYGPGALVDGRELAPKPDPAGLLRILADAGVSNHGALMVGDGIQDARVAARASVRSIMIADSAMNRRVFAAQRMPPYRIVGNFPEAAAVLRALAAHDPADEPRPGLQE